ncbi:MAG: preprotein translocase subunit SecE [Planctomycetia bacterium]|nr:preprotein translocase subunit SecE [Planctomycetia bacterium]
MVRLFQELIQEFFRVSIYKKTQGRIVRQVTFAALALVVLAAVFQLNAVLIGWKLTLATRYVVQILFGAIFIWFSYRLVNYPKFADFLIQVEAEMRKVSWPARDELIRSSAVVICVMFILALLLFGYDLLLSAVFDGCNIAGQNFFKWIGIFS